ncbi:MAG: S8 family serine peptidase [Candidatus Latescibacteria bacterium]|nr:S8 family serine peptidase [Candidatus Latescibacterota bacterium]
MSRIEFNINIIIYRIEFGRRESGLDRSRRVWLLLAVAILSACLGARASAIDQVGWAPGQILVRFAAGAAKNSSGQNDLAQRYGLVASAPLFGSAARGRAKGATPGQLERWYRLRFEGGRDPRHMARVYAGLPEVEWAQANFLRRPVGVPSDSLYGQQDNLRLIGWDAVTLPQADQVVLAIIDSGVDYRHPELAAQIWVNRAEDGGLPGVDDDGNGYIDDIIGWDFTDAPDLPGLGDFLQRDNDPADESGHGTHVAGIAAAIVDNGRGIAGVAPGVRLMPLRAGFNLPGGGFLEDDDIAAAIVYAVDNGADIINMSWGDVQFAPLIRDVVRYAQQAGCVLVAAAGNQGDDEVFYPARLAHPIAVGAADEAGRPLSFSNRGASIELTAPGQRILSLEPGGGYRLLSGTSMAAPHVAGLATLILGRNPHFSPQQVRAALGWSALDNGTPGWDPSGGAGLLQAGALLLDRPPVLELAAPAPETVARDSLRVEIAVEGGPFEDYELAWGQGVAPNQWHSLVSGSGPGPGRVEVWWQLGGLEPGAYQLRLRGRWQGLSWERRRAVEVQEGAPQVSDWRLIRGLQGAAWGHWAAWRTRDPAVAQVRIFAPEQEKPLYVVETPAPAVVQRLALPADLLPGSYLVELVARRGGVQAIPAKLELVVQETRIRDWSFDLVGRLPDGYLLPWVTDFNADGNGEVVQMTYGRGLYGSAQFYSFPQRLVHASARLFIPWNVHDLDGDGLTELMAVDARRVRLLEVTQTGAFPSRVAWEKQDVWGGEVADWDADGRLSMALRSASSNSFQVVENSGDDGFTERALLPNPTAGFNELGERQVVGDLDGDSRLELLSGDADGDLFVYEAAGDNTFRLAWSKEDSRPHRDGRLVGGGADYDGDGRMEFATGTLFQDPLAPQRSYWTLQVYRGSGELQWQVEVDGGQAEGNGLAAADLDGDGRPELIAVLVPQLYIFAARGNSFEPVWQTRVRSTHRPAAGDVDGDGRFELAFNNRDAQVEVVRWRSPLEGPPSPQGLMAYPRDEQGITLEWRGVAGATYRVYRDGEVVATDLVTNHFRQDGLEAGRDYRYQVSVLAAGGEGPLAAAAPVRPASLPLPAAVNQLGPNQLAVAFSAPLNPVLLQAFRFHLEPRIGQPTSVLLDRGGQRLVLGFAVGLPDSGQYRLQARGLQSAAGAPLPFIDYPFGLVPQTVPTRLLEAQVVSATRIRLSFNRPVASIDGAVFSFAEAAIRLQRAAVELGGEVVLELDPTTPLLALGRRYRLDMSGMVDGRGKSFAAAVGLSYAAADLSDVRVFPNPFRPRQSPLTFGGLPLGAQVYIYDAGGGLIGALVEEDGDGGVQWDGRNDDGRWVGGGVYLYRVVAGQEGRTGKFALVP